MSKVNYQTLKLIYDGSQKFSYPSVFLKDEVSMGIGYIYQWVDYCREAIEERTYNETIDSLKNKTRIIPSQSPLSPPFESLKNVMRKYSIPFHYPLEYLEGLRTKIDKKPIENQRELELYCYRMKSSLALMISQVMGINHEDALERIKDLGIALELTHIANHLKIDIDHGLCLIPMDLRSKCGSDIHDKEVQYQVAVHLIRRAQEYFESSLLCLDYLPFRTGALLYHLVRLNQEIGKKIIKRGHVKKPVRFSRIKRFIILAKSLLTHARRHLPKKLAKQEKLTIPRITRFEI